ncbi:MAG: flagellar hook basal-body protein, partial [Geobacteraceae bacterium]|nr:flagellar hook basal-body protein [Geobacteraceae bacterium]
MSITSAMFTGVSGLKNNGEAMNVIGNNISNVNTTGFKGARPLFSDMLSSKIADDSQVGRGSQIQKVDNIFSQGSIETTELVTDLAIQGDTFFTVINPSTSDKYYTRAGAFHTDSSGYLLNPDGYRVGDAAAAAIKLDNCAKIISVDMQGNIKYLNTSGATVTATQKVGIAYVPIPGELEKVGGTLYKADENKTGTIVYGAAGTAGGQFASEKVLSNSLEQSNIDLATQFVNMIITQRAYSANAKTITTTDEMTQEV